jgi:protein-glutamine gamma-glutamyltransferase
MPGPSAVRRHTDAGAHLPIEELRSRQKAREAERKKHETPLGALPELPRTKRGPILPGTHSRAVTGVLLGIQGAGVLFGVPMVAHAQETATPQPTTTDASLLTARLHELEHSRATMSPEALAEARRALWSLYTSTGTTETESWPFEQRGASAPSSSIDATEVKKAVEEMGPSGTSQQLLSVFDTYSKKLSDAGKDELRASVAIAQIRDAAADGQVTKDELGLIEGSLKASFGNAAAEKALLRAFPTQISALDDEAATWLLGRFAGTQTHVARIQSIADEILEGKQKVFDTNGDQKLDTGDLVFTKADDGKVTVEQVSKKLADQVTVAKAMVDASYKMQGSGISFQLIKNHKANPDFWNVGSGGVLTLKEGVKPSDAMQDMIKNGNKYGFECATGLVAVYYHAMLDVLGPKDFDRVASDLRLGPWVTEDDLEMLMTTTYPRSGSSVESELGSYKLTPGHYYYFKNFDVTPEAYERGWQGENVIYLGEGKFYGHGIGLGDGSMFISKLRSEAKPGGKEPALINIEAHLSPKVVELDLNPGQ